VFKQPVESPTANAAERDRADIGMASRKAGL